MAHLQGPQAGTGLQGLRSLFWMVLGTLLTAVVVKGSQVPAVMRNQCLLGTGGCPFQGGVSPQFSYTHQDVTRRS